MNNVISVNDNFPYSEMGRLVRELSRAEYLSLIWTENYQASELLNIINDAISTIMNEDSSNKYMVTYADGRVLVDGKSILTGYSLLELPNKSSAVVFYHFHTDAIPEETEFIKKESAIFYYKLNVTAKSLSDCNAEKMYVWKDTIPGIAFHNEEIIDDIRRSKVLLFIVKSDIDAVKIETKKTNDKVVTSINSTEHKKENTQSTEEILSGSPHAVFMKLRSAINVSNVSAAISNGICAGMSDDDRQMLSNDIYAEAKRMERDSVLSGASRYDTGYNERINMLKQLAHEVSRIQPAGIDEERIDNVKYYESGKYTGEFKNGKRNGHGVYEWHNGEIYDGDWLDDFRTGHGVYKWKTGDVYDGDYVDGMKTGYGTMQYHNGAKYEGEWLEDNRSGYGTLYYTDGSVYSGDFLDGECHGKGFLKWASGDTYDGDWINGKRTGKGVYRYNNGEKFTYEGDFVDGSITGKGTKAWDDGEKYEGMFEGGRISGEGTFYYANGSEYSGEMSGYNKHGHGVMRYSNGNTYDGDWKKDKRDGCGIFTWKNGDSFEGEWENNIIKGGGIYKMSDGVEIGKKEFEERQKKENIKQECQINNFEVETVGWGPDRPLYKMQDRSPVPVFNNLTDSSSIGDERQFVTIREKGSGAKDDSKILIEPGKEYEVDIYFHNHAHLELNTEENDYGGVAQNVKVACHYSNYIDTEKPGIVSATIASTNTDPGRIWSSVELSSNEHIKLRYKEGTAVIHSGWSTGGEQLPETLFDATGTFIGMDDLDGIVFAGGKYADHIEFILVAEPYQINNIWKKGGWGPERPTFVTVDELNSAPYPVMNSRTDNNIIGDERNFVRIKEVGSKEKYGDKVLVKPGKEYEVYIYYANGANPKLNLPENGLRGVALGVRLATYFSPYIEANSEGIVSAIITGENTKPEGVWDSAYIMSESPIKLSYKKGLRSFIIAVLQAGNTLLKNSLILKEY